MRKSPAIAVDVSTHDDAQQLLMPGGRPLSFERSPLTFDRSPLTAAEGAP
jgi:hypothetical protein